MLATPRAICKANTATCPDNERCVPIVKNITATKAMNGSIRTTISAVLTSGLDVISDIGSRVVSGCRIGARAGPAADMDHLPESVGPSLTLSQFEGQARPGQGIPVAFCVTLSFSISY